MRILSCISKVLWHVYAVTALLLFAAACGEDIEFHHVSVYELHQIWTALRGNST